MKILSHLVLDDIGILKLWKPKVFKFIHNISGVSFEHTFDGHLCPVIPDSDTDNCSLTPAK